MLTSPLDYIVAPTIPLAALFKESEIGNPIQLELRFPLSEPEFSKISEKVTIVIEKKWLKNQTLVVLMLSHTPIQ